MESRHFRSRKNVLEYDNVMNTQREVIYAQRQKVLDGEDLRDNMLTILLDLVDTAVAEAVSENGGQVDADVLESLKMSMGGLYLPKDAQLNSDNAHNLAEEIYNLALSVYEEKEKTIGEPTMRELERVMMLRVVDEYWMDNIDAMDDLKQGIGLRAYGQHDPVIAYKEEGYQMFEAMVASIREETLRRIFLAQVRPTQEIKREKVAKETGAAGSGDSVMKKKPIRSEKRAGPNDACPCGSGLKYKKCCMQKDKLN